MTRPARVVAFGPGRVNVIGEHTDYNGGLSLPFAIADGVTVTATPREGDDVIAVASDLGEHDRFALRDPAPAGGWRAFVRGVVAELSKDGLPVPPVRLEVTGTIPRGSGLSSSAALESALCLAILGVAGAADRVDRTVLARLCSRVENTWVGARTGMLDQMASLLCRQGHALRVDFRTMVTTHVPIDLGDWQFVIADSGEAHDHATSGYNARRRECEQACHALGVASLRDADADAAAKLPATLGRRVRHVVGENARVDATVAAFRAGDLAEVGRLLDASHASLRDLYEVSSPAVERTAARLRKAGAAGARVIGGGFGGAVLALLPPDVPVPAGARVVRPGAGARLLRG